MLKHVDEENSEYPASEEYPVLTKQKNPFISQNSRGTVSTHITNNLDVKVMFRKQIFTHWKMSFAFVALFRSSQNNKTSIMAPSCTYLTNAIS